MCRRTKLWSARGAVWTMSPLVGQGPYPGSSGTAPQLFLWPVDRHGPTPAGLSRASFVSTPAEPVPPCPGHSSCRCRGDSRCSLLVRGSSSC